MKANCRKGAALTLVIVAMSLMAVMMMALAAGANTMLSLADRAYCRAVERNLTASALVWAQTRAARDEDVAVGDLVELDAHSLTDRPVRLTVQFVRLGDEAADIRIETFCRKGRQTRERMRDYTIPWP